MSPAASPTQDSGLQGRERPDRGTKNPRRPSGGSDSTFVMTGTLVNRDGHQLLLHGGRMWSVPLDAFIKKVGLLAP